LRGKYRATSGGLGKLPTFTDIHNKAKGEEMKTLNSTEVLFHITNEDFGIPESVVMKNMMGLRKISRKQAKLSIEKAIKNKIIRRKTDTYLIPLYKSFL